MKRSKRLQPVLHLVERAKKNAEQRLGQAQQQLVAEQQKLEQLQTYLAEYQRDIVSHGQQGTRIETLRRMQAFMDRLSLAVEQQQQQIALARQVLAQANRDWQEKHGKYQAMESLIDRSRSQEKQAEEKQLQKEIDELTQNRSRNR